MDLQLVCWKHGEDQIRRGEQVSPATSCRCFLLSLSVETDYRIPATTEGREPSITPVEPGPDRAPSFVGSISDNVDYATTNGSSWRPLSMGTDASASTPNTHIPENHYGDFHR
jgi:hypothetical protein